MVEPNGPALGQAGRKPPCPQCEVPGLRADHPGEHAVVMYHEDGRECRDVMCDAEVHTYDRGGKHLV